MSDSTPPSPPYHESPTFNAIATEADIRAGYRLLLGRQPDSGGLDGFLQILKVRPASVFEIVKTFMSSAEFAAVHHPSYKAPPTIVDLGGFRLVVRADDSSTGQSLAASGEYEPHVTAVFRGLLRPGMHVLDIGANIGFFTMLAASVVGPEGKVTAFEPGQNNVALIHASATLNGFTPIIELWPLGVSSGPRIMVLTQQGSNGFVQELDGYTETLDQTSVVKCVPLDGFCHFDRLDIVKIDIEGGEARAIAGAREIMRRFRPSVCSEFSPPMLEGQSQCTGPDYLKMWVEDRYQISVIRPDGSLFEAGTDIESVMAHFTQHASTHIDLLLSPL
ncbi:MAG: FkbM family methyltransferase [Bryobacteraceae bacterium]|nr:FkbM family methyltransferase [Bryobacteraceae bacterium]